MSHTPRFIYLLDRKREWNLTSVFGRSLGSPAVEIRRGLPVSRPCFSKIEARDRVDFSARRGARRERWFSIVTDEQRRPRGKIGPPPQAVRWEEGGVGKEWVSTCKSRG